VLAATPATLPPARVLLQVHDEVLLEVREDALPAAVRIVHGCMVGCVRLRVPLEAKVSVGRSWGALRQLTEQEMQLLLQPQRPLGDSRLAST